jgi:hypothetical protein
VFYPDGPCYKREKQALRDVKINDGLHFHGIILVPTKSRLKVPFLQHLRDKKRSCGRGYMLMIHAEPNRDHHRFVADYAGKGIKRGRVSSMMFWSYQRTGPNCRGNRARAFLDLIERSRTSCPPTTCPSKWPKTITRTPRMKQRKDEAGVIWGTSGGERQAISGQIVQNPSRSCLRDGRITEQGAQICAPFFCGSAWLQDPVEAPRVCFQRSRCVVDMSCEPLPLIASLIAILRECRNGSEHDYHRGVFAAFPITQRGRR